MQKLTINPPSQVQHQQQERRAAEQIRRENEIVRKENFLQSLPVEILTEILSYASLRTVLAVARSCKWLCTTLIHPDQHLIWRNARKRLSPAPPEPPYDVSEPSYAAIIFSAGDCTTCGARHIGPPIEFQQRVHFCIKGLTACRYAAFSRLGSTALTYRLSGRLLALSSDEIAWNKFLGSDDSESLYVDAAPHPADRTLFPSLFRHDGSVWRAERDEGLKEWDAAQEDPKAFSALLERWSMRADRMPELRSHDETWRSWVLRVTEVAESRGAQMKRKIQELMKKFECERSDLAQCQTFNALIRWYEWWDEICSGVDCEPQIWEELEAIKERRKAEYECSVKQVYAEAFHASAIQSLFPPIYPSSATTAPTPVLSILESYRSLPSISGTIRNTPISAKGFREKLRTEEMLRMMIKYDLEKENARLRKVMSAKLGVKNWKPVFVLGEGKDGAGGGFGLHPLDRLTTLFECTRCQNDRKGKSAGHAAYTALTFELAVRHRCPRHLSGEETSGRVKWDAEHFVPDATGIAAVKLALGLAGLTEETTTRKEVDKLGRRWQCLTCPSNVTMSFGAIVGHAKRHKAISLSSLTTANEASTPSTSSDVSFLLNFIPKTTPLPPNLPAAPPPSTAVPRLKPKGSDTPIELYGCRHCGFAGIFGDSGGELPASGLMPKKLSLDGLVSHVFRKHGLAPLRNEDIWVFDAGDDEDGALNDTEELPTGTFTSPQSPRIIGLSPPVRFLDTRTLADFIYAIATFHSSMVG